MPVTLLARGPDDSPAVAYVSVQGPLDVHTAAVLRSTVLKALTDEPSAVLIDLSGMADVDPIALTVFLALSRAAAAWPGAELILYSAKPSLAGLLEDLAVCRQVPVCADRRAAEALAGTERGPVQVRWDVAGGVNGLVALRDRVRGFCVRHGLTAASDNAELVITELAVNAIVHGAAPVMVVASVRRRYLHLAVRDRSAALPRLRGLDTDIGEGGRGLLIVEALTVAWGATPTADGKVVWCTLLG